MKRYYLDFRDFSKCSLNRIKHVRPVCSKFTYYKLMEWNALNLQFDDQLCTFTHIRKVICALSSDQNERLKRYPPFYPSISHNH